MRAWPLTMVCRGSALVLTVSLVACGGGAADGARDAKVTPPLGTVAEERTLVKKALIGAADLGRPWVRPKPGGPTTGVNGEFCPGQPVETVIAPPRADANVQFTEGTKPGVAIGKFSVETLYPGQEEAWREAIATMIEGCRTYRDDNKFFVTATMVDKPPSLPGAEEVVSYVERIHQDIEHKKLLYVRQYVQARTGRLVSTVQYAVVQPKTDPTGSDLTEVTALVSKQLAKAKVALGG